MTETEARLNQKLSSHKKELEQAIGSARKQLSDKSNLKTLKQYRNMLDLYLSLPKYGEAEQLRMLKLWKSKFSHAGLAIDEGVKQELTEKVKGGLIRQGPMFWEKEYWTGSGQGPSRPKTKDKKGSGTRGIPPEVLKFMRERQRLQQQQQQQGMGLAKKIYKGLYGIKPAKQNYDWIDLVSHLVSKALTKERRGGCMSCSSKQGGKLDLTQEVQTTQPLPYKKSGPKKGSTNPWIEFLKEFKAKHPHLNHREALKQASPIYQAQKQG